MCGWHKVERTANKAVYFSGTISLWNIFLSLICNSSNVSSSSDHLPNNILNYMMTGDGGQGECRTLHLLQKCCVIHALFPAVRRAIPWDKCSLQDSTSKQWCTTDAYPAAAVGFSPILGNPLFHRPRAGWCRHIQVALHEASGGLEGVFQPCLVQYLWCLTWAGLCRATGALVLPGLAVPWREIRWGSAVTCRQPVQQGWWW